MVSFSLYCLSALTVSRKDLTSFAWTSASSCQASLSGEIRRKGGGQNVSTVNDSNHRRRFVKFRYNEDDHTL